MNTGVYHDLKDMLCKELTEIVDRGEMGTGELDVIDKLTHSIKSIETIIAMNDSGYSGASYGRYPMRDARGRYSRDMMYTPRRYSRDSDGKSDMIAELEDLMEEAQTDKERDALRKAISHLK